MTTPRFKLFSFLCAAIILAAFSPANATTLVLYPFSSDTNPTVTASGISAVLNFSNTSQAYIGSDGYGNVLEVYPTSGAVSAATAQANGSYFSLTLTDTAGTLGDLTLTMDVAKGGSSDPRGFSVYQGTTLIGSEALPSGANQAPAPYSFTVDASGLSSTTINTYIWTPNSALYSVDFTNLQVSSVPLPSSVVLFGLALLTVLTLRRLHAARV
jgi:hypothetical protein